MNIKFDNIPTVHYGSINCKKVMSLKVLYKGKTYTSTPLEYGDIRPQINFVEAYIKARKEVLQTITNSITNH